MKRVIALLLLFGAAGAAPPHSPLQAPAGPPWIAEASARMIAELTRAYGDRERVERGVRQAAAFWREGDGDSVAFDDIVRRNYAGDAATRDSLFSRSERLFEQIFGHFHEITRELAGQSDLTRGPILPFDETLAGYDVGAHLADDLFADKAAFAILLNFPLTTLGERLAKGDRWSRREWAEARLAGLFDRRIPADVNLAIGRAQADAARYIAGYNIWMHHCVDGGGNRLFPAGMRLLSHWNLRDEIKADYSEPEGAGLPKQRLIARVMERIVDQTIPASVVDNPGVDWNPVTNAVTAAAERDGTARPGAGADGAREPDTRYRVLLDDFHAVRLADPYSPAAPTHMARRFDDDREIPEERVRAMLDELLSSPLVGLTGALIARRLGRPLEPFDIWYNGFRERGAWTEAQLDSITSARYPTAAAYQREIPRLLADLGFSRERAAAIAANIVVDPARGSGHAMGAEMRSAPAHLRTRVEAGGMNYKGYNIAVHEMGHNVEQTISLNMVDHTLLHGVPNNAFTEALAFVFQARDLELLGLRGADARGRALATLNDFWGAVEIAGAAMIDMEVWHWMYAHPDASPAELRTATLAIARSVWNRYYAPVFGVKDVVLLAIYSHMIDSFLYLPDYPIGHLIAFQIEEQMRKGGGSIGGEFERMAKTGRVTPDLWMRTATGSPVGTAALLSAARAALAEIGAK